MKNTSSEANSFSGRQEIRRNYGAQTLIFVFTGKVPSKPEMQVRKPWCILISNWISWGNTGGGAEIFEKGQ
jgi:hypothetical protein